MPETSDMKAQTAEIPERPQMPETPQNRELQLHPWRCETCGRLALITRSTWAFRKGSSNASLPVHGHWHALCRMPGALNGVSNIRTSVLVWA